MSDLIVKQCDECQSVINDPDQHVLETLRFEGPLLISGLTRKRDLCGSCAYEAVDAAGPELKQGRRRISTTATPLVDATPVDAASKESA